MTSTAVLVAVIALTGCGGGAPSGPSKAAQELDAGERPAHKVCSGDLRTSGDCRFATEVAIAHAYHTQTFKVAGEPFTCIGNQAHWVCRSVRREAWAEHP